MLVQGAGVSESAPNLDSDPSRVNADFVAQGVGNLAASVLRGQPVGGSVGTTALSVAAGARTRWAAIFAGAWMAVILLAFSAQVGRVVMPTLAAILIFAAVGSIRHGRAHHDRSRRRGVGRVAVVTTFVATLVLPIAAAVAIGVALSLMLQLNQEAVDLRVVALEPTGDGGLREAAAPSRLAPERHGARDLRQPAVRGRADARGAPAGRGDAIRAAVVLRLRGRVNLGTTFLVVVLEYQERLAAAGGRLFLSGVDREPARPAAPGARGDSWEIQAFPATEVLGESTLAAYSAAAAWAAAAEPGPNRRPDQKNSSLWTVQAQTTRALTPSRMADQIGYAPIARKLTISPRKPRNPAIHGPEPLRVTTSTAPRSWAAPMNSAIHPQVDSVDQTSSFSAKLRLSASAPAAHSTLSTPASARYAPTNVTHPLRAARLLGVLFMLSLVSADIRADAVFAGASPFPVRCAPSGGCTAGRLAPVLASRRLAHRPVRRISRR